VSGSMAVVVVGRWHADLESEGSGAGGGHYDG